MTLDLQSRPFNRDVAANAGYLYTTNPSLSSQLAGQHLIEVVLNTGGFAGRSVLDIGCGDGLFSVRYWDHGHPSALRGVDLADAAIEVANARKEERPIKFEVGDVHHLPYPDDSFDLAVLFGVLHHVNNPFRVIQEAFRVATEIVVCEPNGSNPGVKVIEKASRYHREHHEKSYTFGRFVRWVEHAGGRVVLHKYAGTVPFFCPDWVARLMKRAESVVERVPILNSLGCAVYVAVATRRGVGGQP